MTETSVAEKRGQDVIQGGNSKEGRGVGAGEKVTKKNVVVDDEAHEPIEKIVTEDLFNKSGFAHYGQVANDNNNPDATK